MGGGTTEKAKIRSSSRTRHQERRHIGEKNGNNHHLSTREKNGGGGVGVTGDTRLETETEWKRLAGALANLEGPQLREGGGKLRGEFKAREYNREEVTGTHVSSS